MLLSSTTNILAFALGAGALPLPNLQSADHPKSSKPAVVVVALAAVEEEKSQHHRYSHASADLLLHLYERGHGHGLRISSNFLRCHAGLGREAQIFME